MYQLLIVCPTEFHSVCEKYAQFKRTMGITCLVHPFDFDKERERLSNSPLIKQFGISPAQLADSAICLKLLLLQSYLGYSTRYVILAGDADKIPVPWFEFVQSGNRFFYPTDLYYADLFKLNGHERIFQTWDPDKDMVKGEFRASEISAIDWIPDLSVGRIPASSVTELENAFARLMNRRARTPRCLILRGNDPQLTPWMEGVSKEAENLLKTHRYSVKSLSIAPDASQSAAQSTLDQFHSMLDQGIEYIFWFGHGGREGWGNFGPYGINFPQEVPRTNGAPIVFSMSCEVGAYTRGVYESEQYYVHGILKTRSQVPAVPDALQPAPSLLEGDFGPEEWLVKYKNGAASLIAGHSWGTLGSDNLKSQPLNFIRMLPSRTGPPPYVGGAFNSMLRLYLSRYKTELPTNEVALNHLLRMHLFGDPTTPLFC